MCAMLIKFCNDEGYSVIPLLENLSEDRPVLVPSVEEYISIHEHCGINLTLDISHVVTFFSSAEQFYEYLASIVKYVRHAHLAGCDYHIHKHLPLGYGNVDIYECMKLMCKAGYAGAYIIETVSGSYTDECYIQNAEKFIATHA